MKPLILLAGAAVAIGALGTGAAVASAAPATAPSEPPQPRSPIRGESVTRDANGNPRIHTWQTGTVTQKSRSSITVRSSDGTTWTWTLTPDTNFRKHSVSVGDTIMIGGPKESDTRTAALITTPPDFDRLHARMNDLRNQMESLRENLPAPPMDFPEPPA